MALEEWTFTPPFRALVHRWEVLKEYHENAKVPALKNAASVLLAFLTPIVAPSVLAHAQTHKAGNFYGVDTICRIAKYQKREGNGTTIPPSWVIDVEYIDWNGENCGFATTTIKIWKFDGYRRVTSLPVFPISFLANEAGFKKTAIERGQKFERLRGYHFMAANGTKILLETEKREQRPVAGKPKLRYLLAEKDEDGDGDKKVDRNQDEDETVTDDTAMPDTGYEASFKPVVVDAGTAAKGPAERTQDLRPLTEDQLLMTSPWLKGFDLKSKDCSSCPATKRLSRGSSSKPSLSKEDGFDDFIQDKGRGLIILMFGPPGVGKTFTAEAVAEKSRVPLYAMSAGDLGTRPSDVEKALERAFELCRMWNAMLLLDEADVFLGARTSESIARNELVSIFLRMLEYYQGILFLTTNRVASIDHAFQSRVDLFLPYHDLSSEARRQVWVNFIKRAGEENFELNDEALDELSHLPLNGREIKNLIKSAQLLSLKSGSKVPMDRLYMLADKRVQALKMLDGELIDV
ncbi:Uu.00g052860.m01.CDS01 [Anthostomella pinea]|uniref:Uu.00g052860.m01.CDS01 n=1 Tax=Anthostomella pinea TaxID=933095 RepID=A0AAI8VWC8_9PEZI|nr:Uu.00g052860.m01.CDS01 [Anthostomella pinea]